MVSPRSSVKDFCLLLMLIRVAVGVEVAFGGVVVVVVVVMCVSLLGGGGGRGGRGGRGVLIFLSSFLCNNDKSNSTIVILLNRHWTQKNSWKRGIYSLEMTHFP